MRIIALAFAAALGFFAAQVVHAQQPRQLDNKPGTQWKHKSSGLAFPASMAGVQRSSMMAFSDGDWDVVARYDTPDGVTAISIYVYQAAVFDPAVWFHEAQASIEARKAAFGTVTPLSPAATFAPPGDNITSGLRITYGTDAAIKSTALAVAPLGTEWIVKIRLSSTARTPAELDGDLTSLINALNWPKKAAPHATAAVIADCAKPMPQLEVANEIKGDGASALLGGLGMISTGKKPALPPALCRDAGLSGHQNLYRTDGANQGYVLSLGDSGRAIIVEPDLLGALLAKEKGGGTSYLVKHVGPGMATIFPAFDRVPPVAQVVALVESNRWTSRTTREKNANVTINSDMLK